MAQAFLAACPVLEVAQADSVAREDYPERTPLQSSTAMEVDNSETAAAGSVELLSKTPESGALVADAETADLGGVGPCEGEQQQKNAFTEVDMLVVDSKMSAEAASAATCIETAEAAAPPHALHSKPAETGEEPSTPAKEMQSTRLEVSALDRTTPEKDLSTSIDPLAAERDERAGQRLYFCLLGALLRELDYYHGDGGQLLDPRKQLLVYHHAARLFDLRKLVMKVLRSDTGQNEGLPPAYYRSVCAALQQARIAGNLPRPEGLRERLVFGHEDVIKFVQPQHIPACARDSCVFLREKPHAKSDHVKHMSPFRDVIKFWCNRNPLTFIDEAGLGVVLTVEDTIPSAFVVISPFLKDPEQLACLATSETRLACTQLGERLGEHSVNFIAKDPSAWRAFIQRRANILAKGSLVFIQKLLRTMRVNTESLDSTSAEIVRELQEGVEAANDRAKVAANASKHISKDLKDAQRLAAGLEAKVQQNHKDAAEVRTVASHLEENGRRMREELNAKAEESLLLESRAETAERTAAEQVEQISHLKNRLIAAEHDASHSGQQQRALQSRLASAEATNRDNRLSRASNTLKLQELAHRQKLLEESNHELLQEVSESSYAIEAFREETETNVQSARTKASESKRLLEVEVAKARVEAEATSRRVSELEHALQALGATKLITETQAKACQSEAAMHTEEAQRVQMELQTISETLEHASASNIQLRADAAQASEKLAEAAKRTLATEQTAADLRCWHMQTSSAVRTKVAESSTLQTKLTSSEEKLNKETLANCEAHSSVAAAKEAEAQAKAVLRVKAEEIFALQRCCAALEDDLQRERDATTASLQSAMAAEQVAVEVASLQQDLSLKSDTLQQMSVSNVKLRTDAAIAAEKLEEAKSRAHFAECGAVDLRNVSVSLRSDLEATEVEVSDLMAAREALKIDVDAFEQKLQAAELARESAVSIVREVEAGAKASLEVKTNEVLAWHSSCTSMKAKVQQADEARSAAFLRAEVAEKNASKVVHMKTDLQSKSETLQETSASNVLLRAESIDAKYKLDDLTARLQLWELSETELCDANSQMRSVLDAKAAELSDLVAAQAAMQAEHDSLARACKAAEHAAESASIATREGEVRAKASLQVKKNEIIALQACYESLQAEARRANGAQSVGLARVEGADKEAATLAQLQGESEEKSETLQRMSASNVLLRAEDIEAKQNLEDVVAQLKASRLSEAELRIANQHIWSELESRLAEAQTIANASSDMETELSSAEVAREVAEAAQCSAEKTLTTASEAESHAKVSCKLKSEEAVALEHFSESLNGEIKQLETSLDATAKHADVAEQSAGDAVTLNSEKIALSETLRQVSISNVKLRAEAAAACQKVEAADIRTQIAKKRRRDIIAGRQHAMEQLRIKRVDSSALTSVMEELRGEAAEVSGRVAAAGNAALMAATEAEESEAHARAAEACLMVKSEEVFSLKAFYASLQSLKQHTETLNSKPAEAAQPASEFMPPEAVVTATRKSTTAVTAGGPDTSCEEWDEVWAEVQAVVEGTADGLPKQTIAQKSHTFDDAPAHSLPSLTSEGSERTDHEQGAVPPHASIGEVGINLHGSPLGLDVTASPPADVPPADVTRLGVVTPSAKNLENDALAVERHGDAAPVERPATQVVEVDSTAKSVAPTTSIVGDTQSKHHTADKADMSAAAAQSAKRRRLSGKCKSTECMI